MSLDLSFVNLKAIVCRSMTMFVPFWRESYKLYVYICTECWKVKHVIKFCFMCFVSRTLTRVHVYVCKYEQICESLLLESCCIFDVCLSLCWETVPVWSVCFCGWCTVLFVCLHLCACNMLVHVCFRHGMLLVCVGSAHFCQLEFFDVDECVFS